MDKTHVIIAMVIAFSVFSVILVTAQPPLTDINWLRIIAENLRNIGDILDKECEIEILTQKFDFPDDAPSSLNYSKIFQVPFEYPYSEISFLDGIIEMSCYNLGCNLTGGYCNILIDGNPCFTVEDPGLNQELNLYEISSECLSSADGGNTFIAIEKNFCMGGIFKTLWLDVEVRPANC